VRGRDIAMVFQEPMSALNPTRRVGDQVAEAMLIHHTESNRRAARAAAVALLDQVGLPDPAQAARAHPHQLSGGQRQRVVVALALANDPALLVCDEPTTALDVTVQARIVDLLNDLRERLGLAILFVSHNLDLVAEVCDRVCVMYAGRIVETGPVRALFTQPLHPYTRLLQRCVPRLDDGEGVLHSIEGAPPRIGEMPLGCAFAARCPQVHVHCSVEYPRARHANAQEVACWIEP
jgi:peptide/nickel transport system ATP-binding protein